VSTATIAILGACSENGKTACHKLAAGNRLLLQDEKKEALQKLKNELEAKYPGNIEVMECFQETGWEADAIVLAIQTDKDREAFTLMKPYVTGKTVIIFSSKEKELVEIKQLLPYSKLISINEADCECVNKMQALLKETLSN
jgi:hypothetical protein